MNTKAKLLLIKLRLNVIIVHYFCNFFYHLSFSPIECTNNSKPFKSYLLLVALSSLFHFQIFAVIAWEDLG